MKESKRILQAHGFVLKKKFGQNFITNEAILEEIVEKSGITEQDIVIEIGPGAGALTRKLAKIANYVIAIEIDTSLEPILKDTLQSFTNVQIIFKDILKWNLKKFLKDNYRDKSIKVVANLPYYITTPILMKLIEEKIPLKTITIMVQKEVADRMQAKPGGKDYGALTLAVEYYANAKIVMTVPPHIFLPPPKVESAVVHLQLKNENLWIEDIETKKDVDKSSANRKELSAREEKELFRIIGAAFEQRRKTLINALANKGIANKEVIKTVLTEMGLSETIRGERLNLEEFIYLNKKLNMSGDLSLYKE